MEKLLKYKDLRAKWSKEKKFVKARNELDLESNVIDLFMQKRISKNLTQKQLATKLGVKQPVISKFENGNFNPTVNFLRNLAEALGAKLEIKFVPNKK